MKNSYCNELSGTADLKAGIFRWVFPSGESYSFSIEPQGENGIYLIPGPDLQLPSALRTIRLKYPPGFTALIPGGRILREGRFLLSDDLHPAAVLFPKDLALWGESGDVAVVAAGDFGRMGTAGEIIKTAVECVDFYRGFFGFYPHYSLIILPGCKNAVGGRPEAPALIRIHPDLPEGGALMGYQEFIIAHEIAHQYFYPDEKGPGDYWLLMALGLWADYLCLEHMGIDAGAYGLFRKKFLRYREEGLDCSFHRAGKETDSRYNMAVVHGGGLALMEELARTLGFQPFNDFFRRIPGLLKGVTLTAERFRQILSSKMGPSAGRDFTELCRKIGDLKL